MLWHQLDGRRGGTTSPRLCSLRCFDAPEAEVIARGRDFALAPRSDHVARAILLGAKERAAAMHPLLFARLGGVEAARGPMRVANETAFLSRGRALGVTVRPVPVGAPFPDVAGHVEKAIAVRRELRHRRHAGKAVFTGVFQGELALEGVGHPLAAGPKLIAPGIGLSGEPSARREFPFGLGRQPSCRPTSRMPRHLRRRCG